ncbi:MAG TPA: monovalent cation/H+ antiporter subunit A [Nitrospiraceae bacterium]|nr:monovalent cation/H+ antiporter subunit A [Nitrospiraceae bacterium]
MTLLIIILLPFFAGAAGTLMAQRRGFSAAAWAAAVPTAASLALLAGEVPEILTGEHIIVSWPWLPSVGLNLSLRLDGLSLLFGLLILGIGLLVILYTRYYLSPEDRIGRLYALLMLFTTAMLGIVFSENALLLLMFWELTSLSSFLLIGFWTHSPLARQGARMAFAVTGGGGLALLGGLLLIGNIAGSFELSAWFAARDAIRNHPQFNIALALILLGAFTKSAQFPFHFWLPAAMAAPTPVSAFLHSATMVKAGVFLLARLYPLLGGNLVFEYVTTTVGLTTMVFGAYVAMFRHDLKGLLAYSTISHLGLIMFLLGLDTPMSSLAAVFHVGNHATFKASLFMAAGIIDHECGTRDMRRLGGLWRQMPQTAALAIVAASAMAGVPLFNGFLSKEMFFAEALDLHGIPLLESIAPAAVTLGSMFSVAYSVRFIHDVFFDQPHDLPHQPHKPPRYMKIPAEVLAVVCIAVGVLPSYTVAPLVDVAARAVVGDSLPFYRIALWHGFSLPMVMSIVALAGGSGIYWLLRNRYDVHLHVPARYTGRLLFQHAYDGSVALAGRCMNRLQNGSLQRYLALSIAAFIGLGAWPFIQHGFQTGRLAPMPVGPLGLVVWGIAMIGALGMVWSHRTRVVAVILAGVVGLVASITFAYFSAPDLSLTQLAVEVVTTVVLLMALARLPQATPRESTTHRIVRDAALAVIAGAGVALLSWAVLTREQDSIAWYFLENSVPGGGGHNVVNVLLVDFRGFDTFGEIIVLGMAAIGVWLVLAGMRVEWPAILPKPEANGIMFAAAARLLLPFALLVAVSMFLRGHDLPGGGFLAGLIVSLALLMQYMGEGLHPILTRVRIDFLVLIGAGVLLAGLTGLAGMMAGRPFLTSANGDLHIPFLGDLPLASAVAFDLGVFMAVLGTALLTLTALGQARRKSPEAEEGRPWN